MCAQQHTPEFLFSTFLRLYHHHVANTKDQNEKRPYRSSRNDIHPTTEQSIRLAM